jgi:hypothetical protein
MKDLGDHSGDYLLGHSAVYSGSPHYTTLYSGRQNSSHFYKAMEISNNFFRRIKYSFLSVKFPLGGETLAYTARIPIPALQEATLQHQQRCEFDYSSPAALMDACCPGARGPVPTD